MESIYAWQERLRRRSYLVLLFIYVYVSVLIGAFILVLFPYGELAGSAVILGFALGAALSGAGFYHVYNNPDAVVRWAAGARKNEDRRLQNAVEKMMIAYGITGVETYIVPWRVINAFVVESPGRRALFVTQGALEKLDDRELEAMLAHEFAHFANRDSAYMTFAVVVAGLILIIAYFVREFLRALARSGGRRRGKGEGPVFLVALAIAVVLSVAAPVVTRLLVSAISKDRDFLADARAVETTKYPPAMISLLFKVGLESTEKELEMRHVPKTFGALFFDFEDVETHPPVVERIRRISELTGTPVDPRLLERLRG